jgi:hypothetical protein
VQPHPDSSTGADPDHTLHEVVAGGINGDPLQQFFPEESQIARDDHALLVRGALADELGQSPTDPPAPAPERPRAAPEQPSTPTRAAAWTAAIKSVRFPGGLSLSSFIGGAAIGAFAVWLIGIQRLLPLPYREPGAAHVAAVPLAAPPSSAIPPASARDINLPAGEPTERPAPIVAKAATPVAIPGLSTEERADAPPQTRSPARAPVGRSATPSAGPVVRPVVYRGSLLLNSSPPGARVFIGGQPVGSTPLELNSIPVGSRAVRIESPGYQPWSAAVQVVADQRTRVTATLTP